MMLSVILLSMFMILLSTQIVVRHLMCGNKLASGLESDLLDTVDWGRKCRPLQEISNTCVVWQNVTVRAHAYVIAHLLWKGLEVACWFQCWKTQLVQFDRSNNTGAIDVKMDRSVLEEKSSFKMLGLTFSSKLY